MDDLDQREAFLKAIFAAPDDDLPRLVFADWLEDRGDAAWAHQIRLDCSGRSGRRGFHGCDTIGVSAPSLSEPDAFRRTAILEHPEWYGATNLIVSAGLIAGSKPIRTILDSPVTQKVTHLDLSGTVVETLGDEQPDGFELTLRDFVYRPTVTMFAVEALVNARECRRVTHLDLRNNDLDNDAARFILRSTNLPRLKSLHLFDGNQLRGRTWQQLLDKFGDDVVQ
jgi:uncharacterized protein (TIGR02996 family)